MFWGGAAPQRGYNSSTLKGYIQHPQVPEAFPEGFVKNCLIITIY